MKSLKVKYRKPDGTPAATKPSYVRAWKIAANKLIRNGYIPAGYTLIAIDPGMVFENKFGKQFRLPSVMVKQLLDHCDEHLIW